MKTTVFIKLKAIPNCSRTEFSSVMDDGCYKIRLKATPVNGKANAELIQWISRQFAVPRDSVLIKTGAGMIQTENPEDHISIPYPRMVP